jgi:hypothetical protein
MRTEVERSFEVLDTLEATDLRPEIERRMAEPATRPIPGGPSPWRRATVVAVALAIFAAAAGVTWQAFEGTPPERGPAAPADPWSWASEGWTELPLPPEVRDGAAIVWTGDELIYWAGWPRGTGPEKAEANGFAFDPTTREWRPLPAAPIEGGGANVSRDERGGAKAVWTGSEVIFWDVATADGATSATLALDPASDQWRRLEDSPHRPTCCGTWAWTGHELVVVGGGDRDDPTTVEGAALDPASGTWRPIADAPIGANLANAVWTGEEVIVVGSELDDRNIAETPTAIALGYRPDTDSWRRLSDAPISPQASETVWLEGRVITWDYSGDSAQYLPDEDRWQGLGRLPLDHGECYVHGVAIDGAVFAWNCGVPDAWYPTIGWTDVVGGPPERQAEIDETVVASSGRAVSAGSVALVEQVDNIWIDNNLHIGSAEAPMHLWIWRPLASPERPPSPTAGDAEYLVANLLISWGEAEAYLPTLATQDVIDRCRAGVGGCAQLGGGGFGTWKSGDVVEIAPGTFEVHVELRLEGGPNVPQVFVVGPGTAADGADARLIVLDVRPG